MTVPIVEPTEVASDTENWKACWINVGELSFASNTSIMITAVEMNTGEKGLKASIINIYISSASLSMPGFVIKMVPFSSSMTNGRLVALINMYSITALRPLSESLACTMATVSPICIFSLIATRYSFCSKIGSLSSTSVIMMVTAAVDVKAGWPPSRAAITKSTCSTDS